MTAEIDTERQAALPVLACACANLRRAARAVTRLYNQELEPDGIEITQFTLLMALEKVGQASQGKLGEILALDSTTLTRTLELMKLRGWVQAKAGEDRRVRIFQLTKGGQEKLREASRHWKRAQKRLGTALGDETLNQLGELLSKVTLASAGAAVK